MIGVRGVVREKLEQQETLDNTPPPLTIPTPHLPSKKRKLSKSDSVDSATGECGRNRNQPAAKRKLVKSDSLDSNCSSQGSMDSSPWAEYAPVTSSSPDSQSAVVVVTAGATKRKRISSAKADRKRRKGLQDDVTTNSDSHMTTEGESQVMKTSMTASLSTTGYLQSRRRSDGGDHNMEVEKNCPELAPIAVKGGSCAELSDRLPVVSTNVEELVCEAETTTAELFNKSTAATGSEKVSSNPHSKPRLTDDNLGIEACGGDGEDLNSSKDSEDVWASFRLKDEILDLEDNNEIWANTMDIFKSMEDMFANTTTTPSANISQDDCTAAVDHEKSNKLEDVTSLANGTGDLSSSSPSHDEEHRPDRKVRRVSSSVDGDNTDSSKENKAVVVIKGTGAKRKSGGHSVVGGKSSLHPDSKVSDRKCGPDSKVSDRKCGPDSKVSDRKCGPDSKVSDRKCGGGRDPKSAVVPVTTVDNQRKNLPASGRKAALVMSSDKSETAAAGSSISSCSAAVAAGLPSSPRHAATPRTSSMVKLIEPSPVDPERLELLAKATSSNNKGRQSTESPLKTVSRRSKNTGSSSERRRPASDTVSSANGKKNPSSIGSCFKEKLLSLLDREKARELAKIQGSKLPRKMQQQH